MKPRISDRCQIPSSFAPSWAANRRMSSTTSRASSKQLSDPHQRSARLTASMEWATKTDKPAFVFPSHVYVTEVDGQMVLLNLESEQYFGLDEVGTNIITRLTAQSSETALTDLIEEYDVDPEVLRRDARDLVDKLLAEGLLMRRESPD